MKRFPHLDLEAAMAAHDMPMYLLERTGVGDAVEYRIYPLNQAAQIGYGDYERSQGMLAEDYLKPMPKLLPRLATARMIAVQSSLVPSSHTNEPSILILLKWKARR